MNKNPQYVHLSFTTTAPDKAINGATDELIIQQLNYDANLWATRTGDLQNRPFPKFNTTDIASELDQIKQTLKARATKSATVSGTSGTQPGTLDLTMSGELVKAGMSLPIQNLGQGASIVAGTDIVKELPVQAIDRIDGVVMKPYFDEAIATANHTKNPPGIQHDDHERDCWLPGLFLIDEIFRALLTTTLDKIRACQQAFVASTSSETDPNYTDYKRAKDDLDQFVEAISQNLAIGDAAQYVPFINYQTRGQTYIRLLEGDDGYIMGAIVHVNDWAGGSHSSGSGIP